MATHGVYSHLVYIFRVKISLDTSFRRLNYIAIVAENTQPEVTLGSLHLETIAGREIVRALFQTCIGFF